MKNLDLNKKRIFEGKHSDLSEKIIKAFYETYNELGYGFSEKVYQKSLGIVLRQMGMKVEEQIPIQVYFRGQEIGEYFADMIINDVIMLELKATKEIIVEHEAQLLNYLKSTKIEVGYVMNFGKSAVFVRKVFDNSRKGSLNWIKK
ncbi:MAG: GxxExxY protein [Anaerolineales bacterium]|nr:GxxExxY protein [Anaerolineales bacterium]